MKITKEQLTQIIKEELENLLNENAIVLSDREKEEAKSILRMGGHQLKQRIEMVLNMGGPASQTYEKIIGAMKNAVFGALGVQKSREIQDMFPNLKPLEGEYAKDAEVAQKLETGSYITKKEISDIQYVIDYWRKSNEDPVKVAQAILEPLKKPGSEQKFWQLKELLNRWATFGTYADETRGVSFERGGLNQALKNKFVIRPEDEAKIPVNGPAAMGSRSMAKKILKAFDYVKAGRR